MAKFFDDAVAPVLRRFPRWLHPNAVTILRAALLAPVIVWRDDPFLAVFFIVCSSVCDIIDGPYARARGIESKTGAILDPVADKIFILGALWGACGDRVHLAFRVAITVLEVLLTVIRPIKERRGLPMNSKSIGAAKTWTQSFAIAFVLTTNTFFELLAPYAFGLAIVFAAGSFGLHLRDLLRASPKPISAPQEA